MINSRRKNRAAIVNKQSSQCNFFGSHIGKPNDSRSNWLQTFNSRNQRMLDPVFILRSVVTFWRSGILDGLNSAATRAFAKGRVSEEVEKVLPEAYL